MRNDIVDKAYLALELTKLSCSANSNEEILEDYNYFLKGLTGIENIGEFKELEEKLHNIKQEYSYLESRFEEKLQYEIDKKHRKALTYLEEVKSDMEPYVYDQLKILLK